MTQVFLFDCLLQTFELRYLQCSNVVLFTFVIQVGNLCYYGILGLSLTQRHSAFKPMQHRNSPMDPTLYLVFCVCLV